MFKKIEIWILYLFLLLGIPISLFFGVLVRQEIEGVTKKGKVDISFLTKPAAYVARLPEKFIKTVLRPSVHRINYPWRENRNFYTQDGFKGVFNSQESYLLLARYQGDLKEGIVELIDLTNFKVLHTWNPDIDGFNESIEKVDEFKFLNRDQNNSRLLLTHPKLTSDGGLLFNWGPLRKIDACSNLVFQNTHDVFHHSIETDMDGNIWVPSYMFPQTIPIRKVGAKLSIEGGYADDGIVKLSPDGEILFEKSVSQIFIDNGLEYLLFSTGDPVFTKDPIHINDIQPAGFEGEFWEKGDVFLSLRHQSMILLYRPSSNKIIWKGTGPFFHPHDVDIINENTISVFNNNSKYFFNGEVVDKHNEVIIYDFEKNQYSSYLSDSLINNDVRTITAGRSEILPNGDLFIEEQNFGRTLYFNSDGTLRWTHVNRAKDGNTYYVAWSRILYNEEDIDVVNNFLKLRDKCLQ